MTTQAGILGIGNYFYMGDTPQNLKWSGPSGSVTNWGITFASTMYGPTTATTGANNSAIEGGIAWTNPSNVTGSAGYATVTTTSVSGSQALQAGGFGFSVPGGANITGVQVTASISNVALIGTPPSSSVFVLLYSTVSGYLGAAKVVPFESVPVTLTFGGPSDLWGNSTLLPSQVNGSVLTVVFVVGNNPYATVQVNDVTVELFTGGIGTPTPTGSGSFSAVNGYTYVVAYGNSKSGEISNASPPSANTGPFTNMAYVGFPVVASTDPQVDQIRVYRTTDSGGGNQFFEISN